MVTVISTTIQEFLGVRYYSCGFYFQHKGKRLHRAVWEHTHNEPVPEGYSVHHIDHNRSNNEPENLALIPTREHQSYHTLCRPEFCRTSIKKAQASAAVWHGSEEGKRWHEAQYAEHCHDALTRKEDRICDFCAESFSGLRRGKFCSNKCKAAWRRKSGADLEERICPVCGASFLVNKYWTNKTCSRSCGGKLRRRKD